MAVSAELELIALARPWASRYKCIHAQNLLDESRYPEGKPGTLSGLIFRLENAKSAQEFKQALGDMVSAVPTHLGSLRRALAVWIAYVLAPHRGIELQERDIDDLDEVKNMLATRIEQWKINLINEGIEKGIAQGIEKGIERGEAAMLTKMLILKYGPLPAQIQAQIDQADTMTLEYWAERMLSTATLEEVFQSIRTG